MSDERVPQVAAWAVLAVAAIAAVISYTHIHALAAKNHQGQLGSAILPLSVDGLVVVASMAMLQAAREGVSAGWLARGGLALGVAATLAANVAYGLPYGVMTAVVSGWPAAAFVVSAEIWIASVWRARPAPAAQDDVHARQPRGRPAGRADRGGQAVTARPGKRSAKSTEEAAAAIVAEQPDVSGAELGRRIGKSPRTGRRLLARVGAGQARDAA